MSLVKKHVGTLIYKNGNFTPFLPAPGVPATPWASIVDGASLAAAMSFANAANHVYKGDEATGATDLEGSLNLTSESSPTHEVADSFLGTDTVEFDAADANQALSAGDNGDVGAGSWAELVVGRFPALPGASQGIMGKRESGGVNLGHEIVIFGAAAGIQLTVDQGATVPTEIVNLNHYTSNNGVFLFLMVNDVNANTITTHTNLGSSTPSVANTTNLDNTQSLKYGRARPLTAGYRFALAGRWIGTSAEGLGASHLAALKTYLGI